MLQVAQAANLLALFLLLRALSECDLERRALKKFFNRPTRRKSSLHNGGIGGRRVLKVHLIKRDIDGLFQELIDTTL